MVALVYNLYSEEAEVDRSLWVSQSTLTDDYNTLSKERLQDRWVKHLGVKLEDSTSISPTQVAEEENLLKVVF